MLAPKYFKLAKMISSSSKPPPHRERFFFFFLNPSSWLYKLRKMYLISNNTILAVLKSYKCKTCLQKINTLLTNERHVLVGSYFFIHVSCLLDFDTNDVVSFNTKYFFPRHMHLYTELLNHQQYLRLCLFWLQIISGNVFP